MDGCYSAVRPRRARGSGVSGRRDRVRERRVSPPFMRSRKGNIRQVSKSNRPGGCVRFRPFVRKLDVIGDAGVRRRLVLRMRLVRLDLARCTVLRGARVSQPSRRRGFRWRWDCSSRSNGLGSGDGDGAVRGYRSLGLLDL
jgi:hypothetical protein